MDVLCWQLCFCDAGTLLTGLRGLNLHDGTCGFSDPSPAVFRSGGVDDHDARDVDRLWLHHTGLQLHPSANVLHGGGLDDCRRRVMEWLRVVESELQLHAGADVPWRLQRDQCAFMERF
jgi:hypothetical protein